MAKVVSVTAESGVNFNVRLIEEGDHYGPSMQWIHTKRLTFAGLLEPVVEAMVAFYATSGQLDRDDGGTPENTEACEAVYLARHDLGTVLQKIERSEGYQFLRAGDEWVLDSNTLRLAFDKLALWFPSRALKRKILVAWDSRNPDIDPRLWLPRDLEDNFELVLLDRGCDQGGCFPATDAAQIELLEAGVNPNFPGYVRI